MKIDIVIPNYNGSHLIEKNILHVRRALEGYQGSVIIVDDGSEQKDLAKLKEFLSNEKGLTDIKLIEHDGNRGFSSAVNTGVNGSRADFVVLLNSDVRPTKNFLKSPVRRLLENPNLFAVGCMDESVEGEKIVHRGRGIAAWKRGLVQHSKGEVNSEKTFWVSGGSSVFRKDIYQLLGGMDELYNPFYWEDIDLSYRAMKSGYAISFDKESVVRHYHDEGAIKTGFSKSKITTTAYRNQFIFIWKNITSFEFMFLHFLYLPLNLLFALKGRDINFFAGLFLAIKLLPAIIKKRKKQRKFYRISDKEIFSPNL